MQCVCMIVIQFHIQFYKLRIKDQEFDLQLSTHSDICLIEFLLYNVLE